MSRQLVVVGLGSNLNAIENLREALYQLRQQNDLNILKVSQIYESEAQLPQRAPESWRKKYLNAAALLEVKEFDPLLLLKNLKEIENKMGRVSAEKWAPRLIDLDILYAPDIQFENADLTIPHPMLFSRPFAWKPAKEVFSELPAAQISEGFETYISDRYFWYERAAIINVTPDSFSDGGKYVDPEAFFQQAQKLVEQGADYLDIGAESTRPHATPITSEEEIRRLEKVFKELENINCKISLDSRYFETIRHIVDRYKIDLINDVSGLIDRRLLEFGIPVVAMHSLTVPADKNVILKEVNPIPEIINWWRAQGFDQRNDIYFDPGFGFGKNSAQSLYILEHLEQFKTIRNRIFLGYSRKSFLKDKNFTTNQATALINPAYAQVIRVHEL